MTGTDMKRNDIVTVAVVNFHPIWGESNSDRIRGFALAAAKAGADVIVFPELALTGYDVDRENEGAARMQVRLAETVPGPTTDSLKDIAVEYGVYILFGMPERKGDAVYNSVAVVRPDGGAASYQKIHPFGEENTWCKKGDSPLIVDTPWGPIGVGICYDTYQFPELVRYYAAKGCRLYVNATAQYSDPSENTEMKSFEQYYVATQAAAVIANEIFVAASNLAGLDNETFFPGASMILGPAIRRTGAPGDPVCHVYAGGPGNNQQGIFSATIDLSQAVRSVYGNNPATGVPDFRPEIYAKLYQELAE